MGDDELSGWLLSRDYLEVVAVLLLDPKTVQSRTPRRRLRRPRRHRRPPLIPQLRVRPPPHLPLRRARLTSHLLRPKLPIPLLSPPLLLHLQRRLQPRVHRDPIRLFLRFIKSDQLISMGLLYLGQFGGRGDCGVGGEGVVAFGDASGDAVDGGLGLVLGGDGGLRLNVDRDSSRRGWTVV